MEERVHPIPFRTRQLSSPSSMILRILTWESRTTPRLLSKGRLHYGAFPFLCPQSPSISGERLVFYPLPIPSSFPSFLPPPPPSSHHLLSSSHLLLFLTIFASLVLWSRLLPLSHWTESKCGLVFSTTFQLHSKEARAFCGLALDLDFPEGLVPWYKLG